MFLGAAAVAFLLASGPVEAATSVATDARGHVYVLATGPDAEATPRITDLEGVPYPSPHLVNATSSAKAAAEAIHVPTHLAVRFGERCGGYGAGATQQPHATSTLHPMTKEPKPSNRQTRLMTAVATASIPLSVAAPVTAGFLAAAILQDANEHRDRAEAMARKDGYGDTCIQGQYEGTEDVFGQSKAGQVPAGSVAWA